MKKPSNSLILFILCATLTSANLVGCKGEHQPRVIKNGNDRSRDRQGGGGGSKPISERGYNALAYTYLTTTVAKNAVRLLSLALQGAESPELLKCQSITKKNEKNSGKEFDIVVTSSRCEMNMSGSENATVVKNTDGEIESLITENARSLEFNRKRSSPSSSEDLSLSVLTKKLTLKRTETGVYTLEVDALLDTRTTRGNNRFSLSQNIDLALTGVIDLRQNDMVLFLLNESVIAHSINKSSSTSNLIETRITRAGDYGANPQMAFTCGTVGSLYQLEQTIKLNDKVDMATPQVGVTGGSLKNLVNNMSYSPKKNCGATLYQIADALSMATILDRAESFSALGEARRRMGRDPQRRDRRNDDRKNDRKNGEDKKDDKKDDDDDNSNK